MNRDALLKIIGPMPDKPPLDAQVIEQVECENYSRQLVEYSVESGERIRAYMLIPHGLTQPVPAILCHHQHAGNFKLGKKEVTGLEGDKDQAYAHELALRGYITFAPDAICFEDRQITEPVEMGPYFALASRLVSGTTLLAKVLHDLIVGIDYLVSIPEVAGNRIGFIGHSYGGRMALWIPAIDKRIVASVSNCGCISFRDSIQHRVGIQMETCVPGILEWGDIDDVIRLSTNAALFIGVGTTDKYSIGAKALFDKVSPSFEGSSLELQIFEGDHSFPCEVRESAYSFLDRHLGR